MAQYAAYIMTQQAIDDINEQMTISPSWVNEDNIAVYEMNVPNRVVRQNYSENENNLASPEAKRHILGIIAGNIPFSNHNHSGRNIIHFSQAKQAIGVYVTNYENRMDKTSYVLTYPGRPLVDTRIMDMIQINNIPSGFTVIVAIMTHTGYNQEDSLLFNKGSVDRGLFQATIILAVV
jgi:DNA-directed RNA polymerase beta subunit